MGLLGFFFCSIFFLTFAQAFGKTLNSLSPSLPPYEHFAKPQQQQFCYLCSGKSTGHWPVSLPLCCFELGRGKRKVRSRSDKPSGECNIELWSSIHISSQELPLETYSMLCLMYLKLKHRVLSITMMLSYFRPLKI